MRQRLKWRITKDNRHTAALHCDGQVNVNLDLAIDLLVDEELVGVV